MRKAGKDDDECIVVVCRIITITFHSFVRFALMVLIVKTNLWKVHLKTTVTKNLRMIGSHKLMDLLIIQGLLHL